MPQYENQFMWYELATTDMAAAEGFYQAVIGWGTQPWEGTHPYTMWLCDDGPTGGVMELPEAALKQGAPPHWAAYVGVTSVDDATRKALSLGATQVVPPSDIPGVGRFSVIFDPQGAAICLFTPAKAEQPMSGSSKPGRFCWHELMTNDMDGAWRFYEAMFGWQKNEAMEMGEMGTYQMFNTGGDPIGGMMGLPPGMDRPAWIYYIAVADLDATLAKVNAHNGQVLNGPMDVPGNGRIAQCMDPQGAAFALYEGE